MGTPAAFDARIHEARPHAGQIASAAHLLELLDGSEIREAHRELDSRVQDAYCLRAACRRCMERCGMCWGMCSACWRLRRGRLRTIRLYSRVAQPRRQTAEL